MRIHGYLAASVMMACGGGSSSKEEGCPEGVVVRVGAAEWSDLSGAFVNLDEGGAITLDLCPGTFEANVVVDVPGAGWDRVILQGHPDGTILDGNGQGSVIEFRGHGTVELRDLTLQGGIAEEGGGYLGRGMQLLILDNVQFVGNVAAGAGGALRLVGGVGEPVTLEDAGLGGTSFEENEAGTDGGAVSLESPEGVSFRPGGWTFSANTAGDDGGAVHLAGGGPASGFGDLSALNNQAGRKGGVLAISGANGAQFSFGRIDASDNAAEQGGGVVHLDASANGSFALGSGTLASNRGAQGSVLQAAGGWTVAVSGISLEENDPSFVVYDDVDYREAELGTSFLCAAPAGCAPAR